MPCAAGRPVERYGARPARHRGHLDESRAGELVERYESGKNGPFDLDRDLIDLDTAASVNVHALTKRLRALLWLSPCQALLPRVGKQCQSSARPCSAAVPERCQSRVRPFYGAAPEQCQSRVRHC